MIFIAAVICLCWYYCWVDKEHKLGSIEVGWLQARSFFMIQLDISIILVIRLCRLHSFSFFLPLFLNMHHIFRFQSLPCFSVICTIYLGSIHCLVGETLAQYLLLLGCFSLWNYIDRTETRAYNPPFHLNEIISWKYMSHQWNNFAACIFAILFVFFLCPYCFISGSV